MDKTTAPKSAIGFLIGWSAEFLRRSKFHTAAWWTRQPRPCQRGAIRARPRSRPNSGPAVTRAEFIDAVGETTRYLRRKSERTTPRAGYALVSSMCSGRSRARRAVGSCARLAWCGRAPRSACRTWPTTFAAGDAGTARRGMKVVESSAVFQPKQRTEKREAVTTANQSKTGPNPNLCPIRRQNRPLFGVPNSIASTKPSDRKAAQARDPNAAKSRLSARRFGSRSI